MIEIYPEGTGNEGETTMPELNPERWNKGHIILKARQKKGWTRRDVEHRSGVTERAQADIENDSSNPNYATLAKLCNALEIAFHELWCGDQSTAPTPEIQ